MEVMIREVTIRLIPVSSSRKLQDVLLEKYKWNQEDANSFAAFLVPMLDYNPSARATAEQCLAHSWLQC